MIALNSSSVFLFHANIRIWCVKIDEIQYNKIQWEYVDGKTRNYTYHSIILRNLRHNNDKINLNRRGLKKKKKIFVIIAFVISTIEILSVSVSIDEPGDSDKHIMDGIHMALLIWIKQQQQQQQMKSSNMVDHLPSLSSIRIPLCWLTLSIYNIHLNLREE